MNNGNQTCNTASLPMRLPLGTLGLIGSFLRDGGYFQRRIQRLLRPVLAVFLLSWPLLRLAPMIGSMEERPGQMKVKAEKCVMCERFNYVLKGCCALLTTYISCVFTCVCCLNASSRKRFHECFTRFRNTLSRRWPASKPQYLSCVMRLDTVFFEGF